MRALARRLPAVALAAACAGGGGDAGSPRVDTLDDGTVRVRSALAGDWADGHAWRLETDLRIGRDSGPAGPDRFAEAVSLAVSPDGDVYVLERLAREVRVFDPAGRHLRTFGAAAGDDPGLADPAALAWLPGGRLLVVDAGASRYVVFDSAGTRLAQRPRPSGHAAMPWPGGVDEHGRVYDVAPRDARAGAPLVLLRTDTALAPADTFPLPEDASPVFEFVRGDVRTTGPVPFAPRTQWRLDPAVPALWVGGFPDYRIDRRGLDGGPPDLRVERDFEPVPVTDAERERALAGLDWLKRRGGDFDPGRIPRHHPPYTTFFPAPDGHLWVLPTLPPRGTAPAPGADRFDVFDPGGRFLGTATADTWISPHLPLVLGAGALHAVVLDRLGVPRVLRLRVVRP